MKISILGTGLMGCAMAQRLIASGHDVTVYNRTREKARSLQKMGAHCAESAVKAVEATDCSILMLAHAAAIRSVLFPEDLPIIPFERRTIIQMGTISPDESIAIGNGVEGLGGKYLEAPILGSTSEAEAGQLKVMVGSSKKRFDQWKPLLNCFCEEAIYVGEVGKAAALKLALNQLIVSLTGAFSYSLGIILRRGIDLNLFMDIIRSGPLYAQQFDKKMPMMLARDFSATRFSTRHLLKDVRLIIDEGRATGLDTAFVEGLEQIVEKALEMGFEENDYSSFYNAVNPDK